jgi:hypothetical protein
MKIGSGIVKYMHTDVVWLSHFITSSQPDNRMQVPLYLWPDHHDLLSQSCTPQTKVSLMKVELQFFEHHRKQYLELHPEMDRFHH